MPSFIFFHQNTIQEHLRGRLWAGDVGVARNESVCTPDAVTVTAAAAAAAIDIHTYKQHKLQRRIGGARTAYETSCAGISATSMTLFAQQHN